MRLRFSFLSYALFLAFKLTIAWQFKPGEDIGLRAGASIQRRTTCEAVSPNVDQSAVREPTITPKGKSLSSIAGFHGCLRSESSE